ncbi:MAG: hypothetical protein H6755_05485 [Candidatus Omnitrophica bacterium]|nr:hypothetical protein [Candidatus Omnitrophota bacterium]
MKRIILILIGFFCILTSGYSQEINSSNWHDYYQAKDYAKAVYGLKEAIQSPDYKPELYIYLGFSYYNLGEYHPALMNFLKAYHYLPENSFVHAGLGKTYLKYNQFEQGEKHLKRALEINSGFKELNLILGKLLFSQTRYKEALPYLTEAKNYVQGLGEQSTLEEIEYMRSYADFEVKIQEEPVLKQSSFFWGVVVIVTSILFLFSMFIRIYHESSNFLFRNILAWVIFVYIGIVLGHFVNSFQEHGSEGIRIFFEEAGNTFLRVINRKF